MYRVVMVAINYFLCSIKLENYNSRLRTLFSNVPKGSNLHVFKTVSADIKVCDVQQKFELGVYAS